MPSHAQYTWQWTITEGDLHNEYIMAIDCDDMGNIYACGGFQDTVDFFGHQLISSGSYDVFIAAFSPEGNLLWVKQGGGLYEDFARDILVSGEAVYVTGGFQDQAQFGAEVLTSEGARDMFLLKYDLNSNLGWAKRGGSVTDDAGNGLTTDEAGNVYVTGDINYTATFGDFTVPVLGFTDIFIAKYDAEGECQWATSAGGPSYDSGNCIEVAGEDLYIAGGFNDEAAFGTATVTSVEYVDIYIAHYTTDGAFVEVIAAGGTSNEVIRCMALDEDQHVYVSGEFMLNLTIGGNTFNSSGGNDVFLARYDPGSGFAWSQSFGSTENEEALGMVYAGEDQIVFTGTFEETFTMGNAQLTSDGFDDGFMAMFDPQGEFDWVNTAGGTGGITVHDCAGDSEGNLYFAGSFLEQLVIGSQTFYPGGAYDLFLSQLGEGGISTPELEDPSASALFISPNPVVSQSVIEYDLKGNSEVVLKLTDITGKEQKTLLNEFQAPGKHHYQLNTADLKPGVYFCILETPNGEQAWKIIKR